MHELWLRLSGAADPAAAASIGYMLMSYQLPGHQGVDAATVPVLLSGLLLLLAAMALIGFGVKDALHGIGYLL